MNPRLGIATVVLALGFLLGGCASTPPGKISALDQVDFISPTRGDQLRLMLRGPYVLKQNLPATSKSGTQHVEGGGWDLFSLQHQLIILNGRQVVRLRYLPGNPLPYQYVPVNVVAGSTLSTAELQRGYVQMQGQWYALQSDVTATPDEQPLTQLLSPAARGTR